MTYERLKELCLEDGKELMADEGAYSRLGVAMSVPLRVIPISFEDQLMILHSVAVDTQHLLPLPLVKTDGAQTIQRVVYTLLEQMITKYLMHALPEKAS